MTSVAGIGAIITREDCLDVRPAVLSKQILNGESRTEMGPSMSGVVDQSPAQLATRGGWTRNRASILCKQGLPKHAAQPQTRTLIGKHAHLRPGWHTEGNRHSYDLVWFPAGEDPFPVTQIH